MTTLNDQIKAEIITISSTVFCSIAKANLIAIQLKKALNKNDFFSIFYDRTLDLQGNYFPYIEIDQSKIHFDTIYLTSFDANGKPVEYFFKFYKENDIQVNYERYLDQYLFVA